MPATKSGVTIIIEGSPNTLTSITVDINDITWIEESPAGTFTVKNKNLSVLDGGVATIGNAGDFSVAEKLVLDPTSNDGCRIDINKGGEFQMFGASEIDANLQTPDYYQRWRWFGKFYCRGNATYRPYISHLYLIWHYRQSFAADGHDRNHDVNDVDYLRVDTPYNISSKWTQPSNGRVFADYGVEKIKNGIFGKSGDPAVKVIEITLAQSRQCGDDYSKIIWEDCIFQYMGSPMSLYPYHAYFKNCQFLQSTAHAIVVYTPFTPPGISNTETALYRDLTIPLYVFAEGCTFTPVYAQDVIAQWGGTILVKDCTFNASGRNLSVTDGGKVLIWTGNTFNGTFPAYRTNVNSMVFYVYALDLMIKSKETGNPLADVMIYIRQKDDRESWLFKTDANGKPITMAALQGKIMLVHKEQLDNVPNFTVWSDTGNSTYHKVWVWKEGYCPAKYDFVMSQDRAETIELDDAVTAPDVRDSVPMGLGLLGELDLPVIGDVEKGVVYDSATKVGTVKLPVEANVRDGEDYGEDDVEFTGQLDLPGIGDVEKGVQFDSVTKTGTFKVPLENIVKKDEQYGKDDVEFTGTLETGAIIVSQNLTGRLQRKTNLKGRLRGG